MSTHFLSLRSGFWKLSGLLTLSSCPTCGLDSVSEPRTSSRIQGCRTRLAEPNISAAAPQETPGQGYPPAPPLSLRRERKHVTARRCLSLRPRPLALLRLRKPFLGYNVRCLWLTGLAAGGRLLVLTEASR